MKIAVYSGSFDPLHIGHLSILRHLSESDDFDMTYLVVSPQNPFKSREKALSAESRLKAAQEALARYPELKARVEDIELSMVPPHYTIRTLDALREREPDNEFTLIVGADNLVRMNAWRSYQRLLCQYGLAVYPRPGYDIDALVKTLRNECSLIGIEYKISVIQAPMVDISSTQIREARIHGEDFSKFLM